jgi:hypothetical protein
MSVKIIRAITDQAELFPAKFEGMFSEAIVAACKEHLQKVDNPDLDKLKESAKAIIFNIDTIQIYTDRIKDVRSEGKKEMYRNYISGAQENLTKLIENVY